MAQQVEKQKASQDKKSSDNTKSHVRGTDLRNQMIQSAEYGEDFRAKHQGSDVLESQVTSNLKPDSGRPKENSRK